MLRSMTLIFYGVVIFFGLVLGYWYTQAEFEEIKKFYPDLTFRDYIMLGDKLRITPNGE